MLTNQDMFSSVLVDPSINENLYLENFEVELVEKLETYLDDFYGYLIDKGLKEETAEKHTANAELFLIQYHAFQHLKEANQITTDEIYDFLGLWYFQKINHPTQTDIVTILTSLKRLFSFLADQSVIDTQLEASLKSVCTDKKYFLDCLDEFKANPPMWDDEDWTDEELQDFVSDFVESIADDNTYDEGIDEIIPNDFEKKSLKDIISQLNTMISPQCPRDNVISLDSKRSKEAPTSSPPAIVRKPPKTAESLNEHALELHRANLIFIRWLDRYNSHPADLPPQPFRICIVLDNLITFLLSHLEEEDITKQEVELGHEMLDLMDRMLWSARLQIAKEMELDLRQFYL